MRSDEMTTLFPYKRAMVGTYCAFQMIVFQTDVIAHLCDGFVLRDFLSVAETEIDIVRYTSCASKKPCHATIQSDGDAAATALKHFALHTAQRANKPAKEYPPSTIGSRSLIFTLGTQPGA